MTAYVTITIDRAAAILACKDWNTSNMVGFDLAELSPEHRATLARVSANMTDRPGQRSSIDLTTLHPTAHSLSNAITAASPYPSLAEPTLDAVRTVLDAQAVRDRLLDQLQADKLEKERADQDAGRAQWEQDQQAWLDEPDETVLIRQYASPTGAWVVSLPKCKTYPSIPQSEQVVARHQRLETIATERNGVEKAEFAERQHALKRAEAEATVCRQRQIGRIVAEFCSAEQARRFEAGLLPEKEIIDAFRESVFEPLSAFSRFEKLTKADVYLACGIDDEFQEPEVEYRAWDAKEATAAEFAAFEALNQVLAARVPHEATATLTTHAGGLVRDSDWTVYRTSIKVEVKAGEISLSRRYACP